MINSNGAYSLKFERLSAERQQSVIRLLLSVTSSIVLFKYYADQLASDSDSHISFAAVITIAIALNTYSFVIWAMTRWCPNKLSTIMAVSSILEVFIITYLIGSTAGTDIPFYLWYIFYVVSVSTRYGWQFSVLALSASTVSFVSMIYFASRSYSVNVPAVLGFTGFLMVLAFMFGQISERQIRYQESLAVVNEFRAELAELATSKEIISHLLDRAKDLLKVDKAFFLPAKRGTDGSEAVGLRSAGADPVLLSVFREGGGRWNVEKMLEEHNPLLSNNVARDVKISSEIISKMDLRNLVAAPMMVRGIPVGVVYAANRRDKRLSNIDLQLLELIATQAAPVVENALLWERLTEAAAAEERLRIARDLHDNFLQTLAAIKLHLERCKILVSKDKNRALEGIDRIHEIATHGLAEVRTYLSELRLVGPEPSRFREVVEKCANDAASRGNFEVHLDMVLPDCGITSSIALPAFQMLRELLNNAVTHSQAKNVYVKISVQDNKLLLDVKDDGVGFDVVPIRAEKASQGHLGLIGVEERARQSNGAFSLTSELGSGTHAKAAIPL